MKRFRSTVWCASSSGRAFGRKTRVHPRSHASQCAAGWEPPTGGAPQAHSSALLHSVGLRGYKLHDALTSKLHVHNYGLFAARSRSSARFSSAWEIVFGDVGAGLYGMLIFVIMAVFIAGPNCGRPEVMRGKSEHLRQIACLYLSWRQNGAFVMRWSSRLRRRPAVPSFPPAV